MTAPSMRSACIMRKGIPVRKMAAAHITLDDRGIAYIDETETKVLTVVRNKKMSRDTPEQLRANMPHLSLAQVYAALAYYQDHRAAIDAQMRQLDRRTEEILAQQPAGPTREELLARRSKRSARRVVAA